MAASSRIPVQRELYGHVAIGFNPFYANDLADSVELLWLFEQLRERMSS